MPNRKPGGGRGKLSATELAAIVESGPGLNAVVDADATFLYCSPSLAQTLGTTDEALEKTSLTDATNPESASSLATAVTRAAIDQSPSSLSARFKCDGETEWQAFDVLVRPFDRRSGDHVAAVHLREVGATPEPSTQGLGITTEWLGRAALTERLEHSIVRSRRAEGYEFALLLVDLDGFKLINDSLGRVRGDEFLRAVARRLYRTVRPGDYVVQLSGDEFAVVVDNLPSPDTATDVARRVQASLREVIQLGDEKLVATAGIGIALSRTGYEDAEVALRDAGTALSRAKAHGPDALGIFDQEMRERALARMHLERDLRQAIERDEFILYFQPEVSLDTGKLVAFEALIRWQHPERGLVSPGEFIPLAEETRLIVPISEWVFPEACRQAAEWQKRFGFDPAIAISVNVAPILFTESLIDVLLGSLERSGLPATSLVVEITETLLLRDFEGVITILNELQEHGIRIHLDDFGTGFSSLSYLSQLPADAVKIDRSFISRMVGDMRSELMVGAIIDLAHRLEKSVIAEGVETEAQAEHLRSLGCELGQGYYFGRPMGKDAGTEWLAARS